MTDVTGTALRVGQRVAYDHYVRSSRSDQPNELVACIGRGQLVTDGDISGIGPSWLVDNDEDGSDVPVPTSRLWLDPHVNVRRLRGHRDFLVGQFIADVERAIHTPDSHTAFDVGLCLVVLLGDMDLGVHRRIDRLAVEVARDGDRCLDVSGVAFVFGPDAQDKKNYTFVEEALTARVDLDERMLRVRVGERDESIVLPVARTD